MDNPFNAIRENQKFLQPPVALRFQLGAPVAWKLLIPAFMIKKISLFFALCFVVDLHALTPLCPGAPLATTALFGTRGLTALNRPEDHLAALGAAKVVYGLADLDRYRLFSEKGAMTGAEMAEALRRFVGTVPPGYKIFRAYAEHEYGLKYVIFQPVYDQSLPWIFAIAGTQSTYDWIVDLDLGRSQLDKMKNLVELFSTCQVMAGDGVPMVAHEIIVAGHSLGGGLAQAIAYQIQASRVRAGLRPLQMETVTFNGFGGRNVIEKYERFDENVGRLVNATNYFVKDDLVSRIGYHIGVTKQLTPPGESPDAPAAGVSEAVRRHFIDTVVGLSDQMASAPERAPRTMGTLNALTKLGGAALFIARVLPRKFEDQRVVKAVTEAVDLLAAGGFKTETDRQARELMIAFIRDRLREMDKPSNGIMAKYAVEDLRKQLARLMASRPITIR
jgi:hypothetical protein